MQLGIILIVGHTVSLVAFAVKFLLFRYLNNTRIGATVLTRVIEL